MIPGAVRVPTRATVMERTVVLRQRVPSTGAAIERTADVGQCPLQARKRPPPPSGNAGNTPEAVVDMRRRLACSEGCKRMGFLFGFSLPVERLPALAVGPAIAASGMVCGYLELRSPGSVDLGWCAADLALGVATTNRGVLARRGQSTRRNEGDAIAVGDSAADGSCHGSCRQ